jgi:phage shock protein A
MATVLDRIDAAIRRTCRSIRRRICRWRLQREIDAASEDLVEAKMRVAVATAEHKGLVRRFERAAERVASFRGQNGEKDAAEHIHEEEAALNEAETRLAEHETILFEARRSEADAVKRSWEAKRALNRWAALEGHGDADRALGTLEASLERALAWEPLLGDTPAEKLKTRLSQASTELGDAKKMVAAAMAHEKRLERMHAEELRAAKDIDERRTDTNGLEDPTRAGDVERCEHLELAAALHEDWIESKEAVRELKARLRALNERLERARFDVTTAIDRGRHDQARSAVWSARTLMDSALGGGSRSAVALSSTTIHIVIAHRAIADSIQATRGLEAQARQERANAAEWERRAMTAIREAREDVAKEALARKREHDHRAEVSESLSLEWRRCLESLRLDVPELRQKVERNRDALRSGPPLPPTFDRLDAAMAELESQLTTASL